MIVVLAVLASGILRGVLIGAVVSILMLLQRVARPRIAELGQVPGSDIFADCTRHPENVPVPGVLVLRLEGALIYFNARHVHERILAALSERPHTKLVVFYLGMTAQVDLAGCDMLDDLHRDLSKRSVDLRLAEVHGAIRDVVRRGEHSRHLGPIEANQTVATVISAWRQESVRELS
jgi:MFS superfamily sulfate permease-like transporter